MTSSSDSATHAEPVTERSVVLDADEDRVRDALTSPDLLTAWLGEWSDDGESASVTTDDGVTRLVERLDADRADEVVWRWSPADDPTLATIVRFRIERVAAGTRLTVVERPVTGVPAATMSAAAMSASATAPAVSWLGSLMALGAVLAVGSLVAA